MTPSGSILDPEAESYELTSEPLLNPEPDPEEITAETVSPPPAPAAACEPVSTYGALHLIGRDPRWLFVFWDRNDSPLPVSCGHFEVRIHNTGGALAASKSAEPGESHWLIPVPAPGACYYAEIGWFAPEVGWLVLARSEPAETAPDGPSADESASFGLLPFSLAFDRLKALSAMAGLRGLSLPELLARLSARPPEAPQSGAGQPPSEPSPSAEWTPEQRALLELLLDDLSIERFAGDSEAIERLFRRGLQEIAASGEELFSRERWDHLLRLAGGSALEGGS